MVEYVDTTISEETNAELEKIKDRLQYMREEGKDVSRFQKKSSKISKDLIIKAGAQKLVEEGVLND